MSGWQHGPLEGNPPSCDVRSLNATTLSDVPRWIAAARPTLSVPEPAVAAFDAFLAERFPRASGKRLESQVRELSDRFTAERAELPGAYLNRPEWRSAYLAYVHPLQVLRAMSAIEEVRARATARRLWPDAGFRVADLGAGLGAMTQALLLCGERPAQVTLLDHQRSALADARELTMRVAGAPAPLVRTADARLFEWLDRARRSGWRYDLVLAGGVLNEIRGEWDAVLAGIAGILDPASPGGGVALLLEPALPAVTRKLMALRESALADTTTIAPCTHGANCPLLALRRDWCFTVRPAELPPRVAAFARMLGHQSTEVRYALWAFTPRPDAAPSELPTARHGRVISDVMDGEQVLCVEGRRVRADVRPRSDSRNSDVLEAQIRMPVRGDLAATQRATG
jgi:SAM-dependent methyltransferase